MVCQECGVNVVIRQGHSPACPQYVEPELSADDLDELYGTDQDTADKMEKFGNAINDAVQIRGEKSLIQFLETIDITEGEPGFEEIMMLGHIALSIGAGIATQIMIEQDILDQQALLRAAGA